MEVTNQGDAAASSPKTFSDIVNNEQLRQAVARAGFVTPTPVQTQAIPAALEGRDLIVQAKTGSGKTLAFTIPLLACVAKYSSPSETVAIVLSPTRELANQTTDVIAKLAPELAPVSLIGGMSMDGQRRELDHDRRIVVGTPGRVLDFIRQRVLRLGGCVFFVVDEADEMFSLNFLEDVRAILSRLPDNRQGLFVSATITPRVEVLAKSFLRRPERIVVSSPGEELPPVEHVYIEVGGEVTAKPTALCDLIETLRPASAFIFCNTKSDTELVEVYLRRRGFDARLINSDLNQHQREAILQKVRAKDLQFLVATDIAARGIDIQDLDLIINYAMPEFPESYVHRSGRTGRAGRSGCSLSLVGPQDFGGFLNLRRAMPQIEFKQRPAPSQEEIVTGRAAHFYELVRAGEVDIKPNDLLVVRKLLVDVGEIENPTEDLVTLIAKLYRFIVEHSIEKKQDPIVSSPASDRPQYGAGEHGDQHRSHGGGYGGGHGGGRGGDRGGGGRRR